MERIEMGCKHTLALVALAVALVNIPVAIMLAWVTIGDKSGSYFGVTIILLPCLVLSLVMGLLAALGSYLGRKLATPGVGGREASARLSQTGSTVGTAIGAMLGGAPLLAYLAWIFQNSAGIVVLVAMIYFGVIAFLAGLTWLRARAVLAL